MSRPLAGRTVPSCSVCCLRGSHASRQDRRRPCCLGVVRAGCERKEAYEDARRRAGITREAVWIQSTPAGDVAVVYMEADDVAARVQSHRHFGRAVRPLVPGHIRDVHGIALEDGFSPPEPVLDFGAIDV